MVIVCILLCHLNDYQHGLIILEFVINEVVETSASACSLYSFGFLWTIIFTCAIVIVVAVVVFVVVVLVVVAVVVVVVVVVISVVEGVVFLSARVSISSSSSSSSLSSIPCGFYSFECVYIMAFFCLSPFEFLIIFVGFLVVWCFVALRLCG